MEAPMIQQPGAEDERSESLSDWTDEAVDGEPSDAPQTASVWTLLVATLILAGL